MTWGILFIIITVAMAVGPIMMFKPSSHTRHLEKLRAEAARMGLKIRTVTYESKNRKESVIAYCKLCETPFNSAVLERNDFAHDIHFYQQWHWQKDEPTALTLTKAQALIELLKTLPDTIVGVEFNPHSVGLWWREKHVKQWGINDLQKTLNQIERLLNG